MPRKISFYTEPKPVIGEATQVAPGIRRITANNPSKMTYHGTNTYLVEGAEGIYVLDPGPSSDQSHLKRLLQLVEGAAVGIILTHHHSDHFGLTPQLRAELDVPVFAFEIFADDTFEPDVKLRDGDSVSCLQALHTPGHASDHLCFFRDDGVLFTGDHVMTWNSSIVAPPDGDMGSYCVQLQRLLSRDDKLYLPGHGPPLRNPLPYTQQLLRHRMTRENAIIQALSDHPQDEEQLANSLYRKSDPHLARAAQRNVEAHLIKLMHEGRVSQGPSRKWFLRSIP